MAVTGQYDPCVCSRRQRGLLARRFFKDFTSAGRFGGEYRAAPPTLSLRRVGRPHRVPERDGAVCAETLEELIPSPPQDRVLALALRDPR